jgi:hypothetical protein
MPKPERTLTKQEYARQYYSKFRDRMKDKSLECYYERKQPKPDKMEAYQYILDICKN